MSRAFGSSSLPRAIGGSHSPVSSTSSLLNQGNQKDIARTAPKQQNGSARSGASSLPQIDNNTANSNITTSRSVNLFANDTNGKSAKVNRTLSHSYCSRLKYNPPPPPPPTTKTKIRYFLARRSLKG